MSNKLIKHRTNSSWTPLNNEDINTQMYEERRALVNKWFSKWSDEQKCQLFVDLVGKLKLQQVEYLGDLIDKRRPCHRQDFTRHFPRALSLTIFNLLDPRSLCRCSQVCWFWKTITDLDQIWMTKCVRLGWILSFSPSPFESGLWKRMYIENIVALKRITPTLSLSTGSLFQHLNDEHVSSVRSASQNSKSSHKKMPPWKASDPVPRDTWRNNYLDNVNDSDRIAKLQSRFSSQESDDTISQSKSKSQSNKMYSRPMSVRAFSETTDPASVLVDSMSTRFAARPTWARPAKNAVFDNNSMTSRNISNSLVPTQNGSKMQSLSTSEIRRADNNSAALKEDELSARAPWQVIDEADN